MSSYFTALLAASICGAVCTLLADGFEKYLKYVASLICIVIIVSPLVSIKPSSYLPNCDTDTLIPSTDAPDLYALSCKSAEESAEKYLSDTLFSEFGIKAVSADIVIDWDTESPTAREIIIALGGEDTAHAGDVCRYFENLLGIGVRVIEG